MTDPSFPRLLMDEGREAPLCEVPDADLQRERDRLATLLNYGSSLPGLWEMYLVVLAELKRRRPRAVQLFSKEQPPEMTEADFRRRMRDAFEEGRAEYRPAAEGRSVEKGTWSVLRFITAAGYGVAAIVVILGLSGRLH